jgi:hypothetical protein
MSGFPREFGQVRRDQMISPRLNTEQRRALPLLTGSRLGLNEEQLVHGHVFSRRVPAELVRTGFVVAKRHVLAGDRAIEVVRVKITRRAYAVNAAASIVDSDRLGDFPYSLIHRILPASLENRLLLIEALKKELGNELDAKRDEIPLTVESREAALRAPACSLLKETGWDRLAGA